MAKQTLDQLRVENIIVPINALRVDIQKPLNQCKSQKERTENTWIVLPDGRQFQATKRFWTSFASFFTISINIFDLFGHEEVFKRISEKKTMMIRLSLEGVGLDAEGKILNGRLLTCTGPSKPILQVDEVKSLIDYHDGEHAVYESGIIQVSFKAPFPENFHIGGSDFSTKFMMVLPIDGFGLPSAYLQMQRGVSSTVISGFSKAFKTVFQLGKDDNSLMPVLERAITTFNNEEGYHTFKQRLENASKSWASFFEAGQLHTLIESVLTAEGFDLDTKRVILNTYNDAVGNPLSYYGVTGANELSQRKAKTIPVKATIFDLFNFVTELNTNHIASRTGSQRLNEWIGMKLTEEYDLENTVTTNPEFKDFFLANKLTAITTSAEGEGNRLLEIGPGLPVEVKADEVKTEEVKVEEVIPTPIVIPEAVYVPAEINELPNDMILLWMNHSALAINCGKSKPAEESIVEPDPIIAIDIPLMSPEPEPEPSLELVGVSDDYSVLPNFDPNTGEIVDSPDPGFE